ncbi:MAG: class I SAM-dependent methyltransferase [Desulfurococcales archaeon]|nr:class I SAM-dependent methyltransferase [Desulfurococcales archaeon]
MDGLDYEVRELLSRLRKESLESYVPLIDAEDGAALATLAFMAPEGLIVDLGAGVGYSALWLAIGARGKSGARIVAVEWDPDLAQVLARNAKAIERITGVGVEVVNDDALEYLDSLPEEELFSLAFVDIEKNQYPEALAKLVPRTRKGGVLAFHNAYFPSPPKSFYEMIRGYRHLIVPTPQGLAVIVV